MNVAKNFGGMVSTWLGVLGFNDSNTLWIFKALRFSLGECSFTPFKRTTPSFAAPLLKLAGVVGKAPVASVARINMGMPQTLYVMGLGAWEGRNSGR